VKINPFKYSHIAGRSADRLASVITGHWSVAPGFIQVFRILVQYGMLVANLSGGKRGDRGIV
jgi:hypothetical protein